MGRRHVQEAILIDPPSWPRAFMLKELVRRGAEQGPRRPDQGIPSWVDAVHGDRTRKALVHRSSVDEVDDPYGRSLADYRATATELAELTTRPWPSCSGRTRPSGSTPSPAPRGPRPRFAEPVPPAPVSVRTCRGNGVW